MITRTLSDGMRQSLDRYIERALRQRFGARHNLRRAVRRAATEMLAAGASNETIRTVLTDSVHEHPNRGACDRVSLLTGLRTSDVLTHQILDWAATPRRVPPAPTV